MRASIITVAVAAALALPLALRAQEPALSEPPSPASQAPPSQAPAPVEDTLVFTPDATAECLSISRPVERAPCIGLAAEACLKDSPGGETAPGRIACFTAETAFWESLIAAAFDQEAALVGAAAGHEAGLGAPAPDSEAAGAEPSPEATPATRDGAAPLAEGAAPLAGAAQMPLGRVQAAWESYRDALCEATAQRRGSGAAQASAQAECRLSETARHALWLEQFVGVGP